MEHFCRLVPLRFPSGASFHRRFIVSPSLQLYSAQLSWQVPNLCLSVTQLSISAINRDSMQTALRNAILDILFTHVFHVKHCDQAVVWQYTSVWWQPDTDPWPALVSSVNCCQWTQPVSTLWASLLLSTLAAFKVVFGLQQPTHTHTHTPMHGKYTDSPLYQRQHPFWPGPSPVCFQNRQSHRCYTYCPSLGLHTPWEWEQLHQDAVCFRIRLNIQHSLTHEADWKTRHSGLECMFCNWI